MKYLKVYTPQIAKSKEFLIEFRREKRSKKISKFEKKIMKVSPRQSFSTLSTSLYSFRIKINTKICFYCLFCLFVKSQSVSNLRKGIGIASICVKMIV